MESKGMKRVGVEDLRVGMFVGGVVGSWTDHGLWRTRFDISNNEMLEVVRQCGAKEFWIDPARSRHSIPQVPAKPRAPGNEAKELAVQPAARHVVANPVKDRQAAATSFSTESVLAAKLCQEACGTMVKIFDAARIGLPPDIALVEPIVEDIVDSVQRNATALISLARLKSKDDYTYMHSVSVCGLMVALAMQMGLNKGTVLRMGLGGLLHDVGKAHIPLDVLNKPGKLTDLEFELVKTHASQGHAMLVNAGLVGHEALDVCLRHHEKFDGTGYPEKLSGEQISLAARMGAICDVYDAVTSVRPYKEAWDPSEALKNMASWHGHFDRTLLAMFVKLVGAFPVGSLVRLHSGRLAVVVESDPAELYRPIVKVFHCAKSNQQIPIEVVDLAKAGATEKIVSRESREGWSSGFLNSLLDFAPVPAA